MAEDDAQVGVQGGGLTYEVRSPRTEAEFEAYFEARWRWLREPLGLPRGSERSEDEDTAIHRAAFATSANGAESQLVLAVARIHWNSPEEAQIRYMAAHPEYRGLGLARKVLESLEEAVWAEPSTQHIIANAREGAVPFYLRCGYKQTEALGNVIADIPHWRMVNER